MSATYTAGDSIKLTYTVRKANGDLSDATVTLALIRPDGTDPGPPIAHPSLGTYTTEFTADQAGLWRYRWAATGAATDAEEGHLLVEPAAAQDIYVTVAEIREQLADTGTKLPIALLTKAVKATSRAIDNHCGRRFWLDPSPTVQTYRPDDPSCALVNDIGTDTGLVVRTDEDADGTFETTWAASDYQLEPLNASANGGAFAWWQLSAVGPRAFPVACGSGAARRPRLQVTARHGWSQIPDPVREAAMLKAVRLFRRKDAPFAIDMTGLSDFGPVRITRQDADVIDLLGPYMRAGAA